MSIIKRDEIMKAAQIKNYGDVNAIEINGDTEKPSLESKQALVEVYAASLNRIDSVIRNGYAQAMMPLSFPSTVGGDFSGVISDLGEGVTEFVVGDEVYGNAGAFLGGSGSIAELVASDSAKMSFKPKTLDFTQSASLPLVGASAVQGIEEEIKVKEGQKILIQGGAGGIGSIAIQIAKMHGAYVATTVRTDSVDFAQNLGADEVIDYKVQDVTNFLRDYDAVFDTAGGNNTNDLFKIIKRGGTLVSMAGMLDQDLANKQGVTAISQMTLVSTEQLQRLARYVDSGRVKVQIEKTFPFLQVKEAFTYFETQHPKGKVVVEIK
jgi:NADPH:quinone reductase-like Zn-dependent oxidoreductase